MSATFATMAARLYGRLHQRVLHVVEDLDEAQLAARVGRATSIGFNLWHIARWDDWLQATIPEMTTALHERFGARREIWVADGLAGRWGFDAEALGFSQTGMGMDEGRSALLPMPSKAELSGYVGRVFAALDEMLGVLDDAALAEDTHLPLERITWSGGSWPRGKVGSWVLGFLDHGDRHLGMIEGLKGALGLRGTASV